MADIDGIREYMAVYGSCGDRVGTVDGVRGEWLCLTRDPHAGDEPHCVPLGWVVNIGQEVGQKVGQEVRRERLPGEADLQLKRRGKDARAIPAAFSAFAGAGWLR